MQTFISQSCTRSLLDRDSCRVGIEGSWRAFLENKTLFIVSTLPSTEGYSRSNPFADESAGRWIGADFKY
jgi:hypothetical protein